MGLNDIESSSGGSSSASKSTMVQFKNPDHDEVEAQEGYQSADWYAAVRWLRKSTEGEPQVVLGNFAHAAQEADDGNTEPLRELFSEIAGEEL